MDNPLGLAYLGAGLGAGLAVIGGGLGIGKLAASAMEGIARLNQRHCLAPGANRLCPRLFSGC